MCLAPDLLVIIAVEDFQGLSDLVLVAIGRAVTHVVQDLIPDCRFGVLGKLESS